MKILITGGAGFLGSNLIEYLLERHHDITVVDNLITGVRSNLTEFESSPHFEFIELSITDPTFLPLLSGHQYKFDRIYHLACPTGVPNIERLGEEMIDTCSTGTKNVLELARHHGARVLFTSSSEIYGNPLVAPQTERYTGNVDPQGPRANYEEGKRFSEALLSLFVTKYGLNARTVRLFNVYGPKMSLTDDRVISRFATQCLSNSPLTLHGNGTQSRTMCYVSDLVRGLELVMEEGTAGEVYNVGSEDSISMAELATQMIKLSASGSVIMSVPRASHDHESRIPSLIKVRQLGWQPEIDLETGLLLTLGDFKERMFASELQQYDMGLHPSIAHRN